MPYRVIDLKFSPRLGRIDDEPLQRILHGHALTSAQTYFYVHEGQPHLLVALHYRLADLGAVVEPKRNGARKAGGETEPAGEPPVLPALEGKDQALFETLRTWRTARARADAVPPYVILTNVQLGQIARERPSSLAALGKVPGVGENRLERWGRELLQVIADGVVALEMESTRKEIA